MKHLLLSTLMVLSVLYMNAQVTYETKADGNWNATGTWTSSQRPPTSGTCNCVILIKAGHYVTINVDVNIANAKIVLEGTGSEIRFPTGFLNYHTLALTSTAGNTSGIVVNPGGKISTTNAFFTLSSTITINGTTVFNGSTNINTTTDGVVSGPASTSSAQSPPVFVNVILPVKLSEFNASSSSKDEKVSLSWKTDQEVNSDRFEIERSGDGKDWSRIGSVKASGNSSIPQSYSFTDGAPGSGINYYRLRIVDIDARYEYSPVKTATITVTSISVRTYPNPASSVLNVTVNQPAPEPYKIRLINRNGQVIFEQQYAIGNNRATLNVSNIAEGNYFLEVSNNKGFRQVNKVAVLK